MEKEKTALKILRSRPVKIVVLAAVVFNLLWFLNWYTYHRNTDGYTHNGQVYFKEKSEYSYSICEPDYPRFTGNYGIAKNDGINGITLIVWDGIFSVGETEYGIEIVEEEDCSRFYIDRNSNYVHDSALEYTREEERHVKQVYERNKSEVQKLMDLAKKEWKSVMR